MFIIKNKSELTKLKYRWKDGNIKNKAAKIKISANLILLTKN